MTTQHTPGPWKTLKTFGGVTIILDPEDKSVAYLRGYKHPYKSNARLIAAAPDLLEALKVARHMIVEDGTPIGWSVSRLDEVIAKATGQV
jgi:hypothetical protein